MDNSERVNYSQRIEDVLDQRLPPALEAPGSLHAAMRYSVLDGGKRIRARLVYATGQTLTVNADCLDAPAAAAELIHAYSLVHDDLPAMDDDVLRRGKDTAHIAFGEAIAILAGDALQNLAFETLAADPKGRDACAVRNAQIAILAAACGSRGMVGGQVLDMASEGQAISRAELETIHQYKTGALLRACVLMAAAAADPLSGAEHAALDVFALRIGLAFQVHDDVLDIESTTEQLGKTQGADIAHHKATYPALLGLAAARTLADGLYAEAIDALAIFGERAAPLRAIAAEIVKRDH